MIPIEKQITTLINQWCNPSTRADYFKVFSDHKLRVEKLDKQLQRGGAIVACLCFFYLPFKRKVVRLFFAFCIGILTIKLSLFVARNWVSLYKEFDCIKKQIEDDHRLVYTGVSLAWVCVLLSIMHTETYSDKKAAEKALVDRVSQIEKEELEVNSDFKKQITLYRELASQFPTYDKKFLESMDVFSVSVPTEFKETSVYVQDLLHSFGAWLSHVKCCKDSGWISSDAHAAIRAVAIQENGEEKWELQFTDSAQMLIDSI